jgi:hypothetical protein
LCSLSHPNLSQSFKLLLIADQKEFPTSDHTCDEVLPFGKFTTEFLGGVDGGVHLSSEFTLCIAHSGNHVHERHLSYHHKIYVAGGSFGSGRHGTKDEGGRNTAPQLDKRILQNLGDPEGLSNKPSELVEDLAAPVCLEVRLAAFECAIENAGAGQLLKLSLDGAGAKAHDLDDLPLIESLTRMAEEQSKNGLPCGAKECIPERALVGFLSHTHNGYDNTHLGF